MLKVTAQHTCRILYTIVVPAVIGKYFVHLANLARSRDKLRSGKRSGCGLNGINLKLRIIEANSSIR